MTLIAALHLVVPLILILWTWRRSYASISGLSVQVLVLMSYTTFIFLMGAWAYASFYLRYVILIVAVAVIIRSLVRVSNLPGGAGWRG